VVVEIGFQPERDWSKWIETFRRAGFDAWWFYADGADARQSYIRRNGTAEGFDRQWRTIESQKAVITSVFSGRMIRTLVGEAYLRPEDIARQMTTYPM